MKTLHRDWLPAGPLSAEQGGMLRVRSLKRVTTGDPISLPAAEALPISASQSFRLRVPITPVVLLFLCGLVAARVFPDSSLISSEPGLGPGFVLPKIQQPQLAFPEASFVGANLTGLQLRCQSFCLTRDTYVTRDEVSHCQSQCLAHPEVMGWMRALEASAAAPVGVNPDRQLIFAAWYAEGERGSEVRSESAMHMCSLLQQHRCSSRAPPPYAWQACGHCTAFSWGSAPARAAAHVHGLCLDSLHALHCAQDQGPSAEHPAARTAGSQLILVFPLSAYLHHPFLFGTDCLRGPRKAQLSECKASVRWSCCQSCTHLLTGVLDIAGP